MRIGAIDIGTNTILLLIADVERDGTIRVIRDEQVIARLGKGVDEHRTILPETFDRALAFLSAYKSMIDGANVDRVVVCGTSFLRDANNKKEFTDLIQAKLGFQVRVLSGDEESLLTYAGAVSEFHKPGLLQQFAVLDIGGGSTELTVNTEQDGLRRISLDIGSVRVTERFLKTSPPSESSLKEATRYVREQLIQLPQFRESTKLVGVAGTLTTLAALELKLTHYDRTKVSGHILTKGTIESFFYELSTKNLEEIKAYPQILPGRADILLAGILILLETLSALRQEEIIVSDRGLRYGMALEAARK